MAPHAAFIERQRARLERRARRYGIHAAQHYGHLPSVHHVKRIRALPVILGALALLDTPAYGTCVDCGGIIPRRRLVLVPAALRCTACQHIYEEGHGWYRPYRS